MTEQSNEGLFSFTTPLRGFYVNVTKARAYKENGKEKGEPKFDSSFFWAPDHADFATLKARAVAVAKAKWPGRDIPADYKSGELRMPWMTGDRFLERRIKKLSKVGKEYD